MKDLTTADVNRIFEEELPRLREIVERAGEGSPLLDILDGKARKPVVRQRRALADSREGEKQDGSPFSR